MRFPVRLIRFLACLGLLIAGAGPGAWAGGSSFGDPDEHSPDEGPAYWGFVKDAAGKPVVDAKVSAAYKKSLTLVTRTNAIGAYRVRGFKKDVNPNDVTITCSKDGYKQIRTFRRPPVKGKPIKSIETECRLQRQ